MRKLPTIEPRPIGDNLPAKGEEIFLIVDEGFSISLRSGWVVDAYFKREIEERIPNGITIRTVTSRTREDGMRGVVVMDSGECFHEGNALWAPTESIKNYFECFGCG